MYSLSHSLSLSLYPPSLSIHAHTHTQCSSVCWAAGMPGRGGDYRVWTGGVRKGRGLEWEEAEGGGGCESSEAPGVCRVSGFRRTASAAV